MLDQAQIETGGFGAGLAPPADRAAMDMVNVKDLCAAVHHALFDRIAKIARIMGVAGSPKA